MCDYWSIEEKEYDEIELSTYEYFSSDTVARLLMPTGILENQTIQFIGSFEEFVFLVGNKDEVYTKEEIEFISTVGEIIVFDDYFKRTRRGLIPCRVIATKDIGIESLTFSIAFTKIMNKASNGFNICFIVSKEGVLFTCRSFSNSRGYYISNIIENEEQLIATYDSFLGEPESDSFIDYYNYVREAIQFRPEYSASQLLELDNRTRQPYAIRVIEADEYLFRIEPTKVNTLEMLFEAEELERIAFETEKKNEALIEQNDNNASSNKETVTDETKAMLNDPEKMIKQLKKERGINIR